MEVKFRESVKSDISRCFEIWCDSATKSSGLDMTDKEKTASDFFDMFQSANSITTVALDQQDNIIGWQGLFRLIVHPLMGQYTAQVSIYLDRHSDVRGLASKLTQYTFKIGRDRGIEQVYAWITANNKAAIRLARKFAVKEIVTVKSDLGHVPNLYLFIINLK